MSSASKNNTDPGEYKHIKASLKEQGLLDIYEDKLSKREIVRERKQERWIEEEQRWVQKRFRRKVSPGARQESWAGRGHPAGPLRHRSAQRLKAPLRRKSHTRNVFVFL